MNLKKVKDLRNGLAITKKVGIRIHTYVMVGYPGERYEYLIKTLELMKEILPDEFSFTIAYPLPGTKLYDLVEIIGDEEKEWEFPNENRLIFRSDISEAALRFFIKKTRLEISLRRIFKGKETFGEWIFSKLTNLILKGLSLNAGKYDWYTRCQLINAYINSIYNKRTNALLKIHSSKS